MRESRLAERRGAVPELAMRTVLVTGARGFVGSHVMRRLRLEPAVQAIAGSRDGRDGSRRMDLLRPSALPAALAGIDAVVHCAVGDREVTVDGTQALLSAAAAAGVRRLVHLSSIAVYGAAQGEVDERTPRISPHAAGYAGWKSAAEEACLAQDRVEVVRLRPAIIYGAGSALWVRGMAARIAAGRWGTFGEAGEGTCNLVHAEDVAEAVVAALRAPAAAGGCFNVSGPEAVTWNEWFRLLAEEMGQDPLPVITPARLAARLAIGLPLKAVGRAWPGFAAGWLRGVPALGELRLFRLKARYAIDAARSGLGWAPRIGIADGLRDSLDWLATGGRTLA